MMESSRFVTSALWLLFLALLLVGSEAFAQADKAAAEALFDQGRAAFDQEDYTMACEKFAASQAIDAAVGTLLFLGECNEKQDKKASAWAAFKQAVSLAERNNDKRLKIARVRAAAVAPQVSKLILRVESPDLPGLTLRRNDVEVPKAGWETELPADAGEYTITASAPGKKSWKGSIEVPTGGKTVSIDVPALSGGDEQKTPTAATGGGSALPVVGLVIGGVGVVGIVVGSALGLMAKSANDDSLDNCRTVQFCTQEGLDLREDARGLASGSTISFVAGGVLAAAGVTMFLLAPSTSAPDSTQPPAGKLELAPTLGYHGGGLQLRGEF